MKHRIKRILAKERIAWRWLGIRATEGRQMARTLLICALYLLPACYWLATEHWFAFRQVVAVSIGVVMLLALVGNAVALSQRKHDARLWEALEDAPPVVVTHEELKHSERLWEMHTDNRPIEIIPDEELEQHRKTIQEKIKRARSGNIELDIHKTT